MHFTLEKNIDCSEVKADVCQEAILNELKAIGFPIVDVPNDKMFGHVSIFHEKNKHQIWIFYYDTDGMTESVSYDWEPKDPAKTYDKERTIRPTITGTNPDGSSIPETEEQGGTERVILQPHDRTYTSTPPTKTQIINAIANVLTASKTLKLTKIKEAKQSIAARALLPGIINPP